MSADFLSRHDKNLSVRAGDLPVRAVVLRGLNGLISQAGGPPEFLQEYGVDEGAVATENGFLSVRLVERVLEDAARRFGMPTLGLQMASQQDLQILGPLAIAMENSRTVGDALECANRYMMIMSPALSHAVIPDPLHNPGLLGIRYASLTGTASPQALDYGLGVVHRVLSVLNGGERYLLRSVQLPHARLAPDRLYRDHFGADVDFNCRDAVLRVPRQLLDVPVVGGNSLLRDIAMDFLESHFSHHQVPVTALASLLIENHLGPDRPDLAKVARLLNLHPRSLQRSLATEGTSFTVLVDEARRRQTLDLVTDTDLPFSQVAVQVGLREQSSLTRAVRRWFGMSPSALRAEGAGRGR